MNAADCRGESYQVTLPGELGLAFLATFATMGVHHATVSSVFWLPAMGSQGIADIAAMLQERGLVILDIRRLHEPDARPTAMSSGTGDVARKSPGEGGTQDPACREGDVRPL